MGRWGRRRWLVIGASLLPLLAVSWGQASAQARGPKSARCAPSFDTSWVRQLSLHGVTCAGAATVANAFAQSLQGEEGYIQRFTFRGRHWTCREHGYGQIYSCATRGKSLQFVELAPNLNCSYRTLSDLFDGFDMTFSPAPTGGITCSAADQFVQSLYGQGLNASNNAHQTYPMSGFTWTCSTDSYARSDGYYSGTATFDCHGRTSSATSLEQDVNFSVDPELVVVSCDQALCTESAPQENGDYGDQSGWQAAGETYQTYTDPMGGYSAGPVPAPGHYNQWALCVWEDLGAGSGRIGENYGCEYPGS